MHVCPSTVWMVRSSTDFLSLSLDNVHGRPRYHLSMDNVHGQPHYCPWETSSFINHILVQEHFLVSLVVLDPICSLGHGRSLWTNWRWTNFSLSYQKPITTYHLWFIIKLLWNCCKFYTSRSPTVQVVNDGAWKESCLETLVLEVGMEKQPQPTGIRLDPRNGRVRFGF